MRMGRRWEWFGVLLTAVMVMAWSSTALGQIIIGGSWTFKGVDSAAVGSGPAVMNFGPVVTENTAVRSGSITLEDFITLLAPDSLEVVKVVVRDTSLNRVVFNTQVNVEYSGDTIIIPMRTPTAPGDGTYRYGDYSIPFTMSFRPNQKGAFVDTLPVQIVYPQTFDLPSDKVKKLRVRGRGIGFLKLRPPRVRTPVDSGVIVDYDALSISTSGDKTDTLRVGKAWPQSFGIVNTSRDRVGKISDMFAKRPEFFIVANPQLEIQPGDTQFVQVLFTPRTLTLHRDTLKIISDDFAVDTPRVALRGTGELTFDGYTGDVDTLDNKLIYDSLQWAPQLGGGYRDTVLLFSNRIDKRILGDVTAWDGSAFKVLRLRGADTATVDTLVAVGGQVTYREKTYSIGDTIQVGINTFTVGDTTVVPNARRIDVTLADSVAVWLRFAPQQRGEYQDSLILTYRPFLASDTLARRVDTVVVGTYPMFGRGTGGEFKLSKTAVDFGPLTPPLTKTDTILVRNDSGQVAVNVSIDTAGVDPVFTLRSDLDFSVSPGQVRRIIWEYTAADNALHTASVPVTSSDPNNPSVTLSLSGGTQAPLIASDKKTLAFGDVVVGDSKQLTFRVSNNGLTVLNVTGMTFASPAQYSAAPTTFTLNPGEFQDVTVTFTPSAAVAYPDTLRIATNDPANPSYKVALSGGGSDPTFASETSLTFGVTTLGSGFLVDSFCVTNNGTRGNMSVRLNLLYGTYFSLARPGDSLIAVPAGATVCVPVRFNQLITSVVTDSLILRPNDPAVDTAYVALTGGGFYRKLDWQSGPLAGTGIYDFGKVSLTWPDTLTSVMTNLGNDTLRISEVTLYDGTQGFKRLTPSTGELLQDEFFNVTVVFAPPDTGLFVDTMLIVAQDSASLSDTIIVPLTGVGFVLGLHPGMDPFVFDTTQVSGTRLDSVALINTGDSSIYVDNAWLAVGAQFGLILPDSVDTVPGPGEDTIRNFTFEVLPSSQVWLKAQFSPTDTISFFDTATVLGAYTLDTIYTDSVVYDTLLTDPELVIDTLLDTFLVELVPTSPDMLLLPMEGAGAGGRYTDNVDSLSFPPVLPFSSSTRSLIVKNTGNQPLALTSIKVKGTSGTFSRQSPASVVVGAGEQTTVTVKFQPLSSNAFVDTLMILTDDPSADTVRIPMFGQTNDPDIDFSPGRLTQINDYSLTVVSPVNKSQAAAIKIFNVGLGTLVIDSAKLTFVEPPTPWSFVRGQATNKAIASGDSLVLSFVFAPAIKDTFPNTMTLWSSDPDEGVVEVPITGIAVSGQLSAIYPDPVEWDLGAVKVNTTFTSDEVRIRNVFGSDVKLSLADLFTVTYDTVAVDSIDTIYTPTDPDSTTEFVVERSINAAADTTRSWQPLIPTSLPTLPSNQIMSLRLQYTPVDTGADDYTFRVVGTVGPEGDTVDIPLFARGAAPMATFNPDYWDFGQKVIVPSFSPDTSYHPDSLGTKSINVVNDGEDDFIITDMYLKNSGAAAYNDTTVGIRGFTPLPFTVSKNSSANFVLMVKPLTRKIYYDTLVFVTNDPTQPLMYLRTRLVGIAPGDIGHVDTVRISNTIMVGSQVVVPVNLIHDEPLKRIMIPLKYSSPMYECVGIDFKETLLETVDGRLPTIDTVNNTIVIKATAIFSPPIYPNQFIGTEIARLLFQRKSGVNSTDSTITIDTLPALDTSSVQFVLQDTAGQVILPVFVSGRLDVRTAVDDDGVIPKTYALDQNFPNPFNPTTTIAFQIPKAGWVRLEVFNLLGQRILTLVDDVLPAGRREVLWNGQDQHGREVSSGIYFYRLSASEFAETKKMILMK